MEYQKSQSLQSFINRLQQIDELLQAREMLIKYQKIEEILPNVTKQHEKPISEITKILFDISKIAETLSSDPGRGRREISPINHSAYVLLISFFQGFIEDLYYERGLSILKTKIPLDLPKKISTKEKEKLEVQHIEYLKKILRSLKPQRSNPHPEIINKYFANIGIYQLMNNTNVAWQKQSNKTIHDNLTIAIQNRNKISHGNNEIKISKREILNLKDFLLKLSETLDAVIYKQLN